jgi:ribulose-phosphate 3-epimerase
MPITNTSIINALPKNRLIAEFSMWSANLINFEKDLARIQGHADMLHIDVADGHFAPALLFFPDLVAAMRRATRIPIHIHLMCADDTLLSQVAQFAEAGCDVISVHAENKNASKAIAAIQANNIAAGMVLKVDTPVTKAKAFLKELQFLTLLGTAIGVKGQSLNDKACDRLREAKAMISDARLPQRIVLAADGGIRENTVPELRKAEAETVVLGSLAFGAADLGQRMTWLKTL